LRDFRAYLGQDWHWVPWLMSSLGFLLSLTALILAL
jgi:hypothetical protein